MARQTRITRRSIADAARRSRAAQGRLHILLWADGTVSEAVGSTDTVCLLGPDGSREFPVVRLTQPHTVAEVQRRLAEVTP